MSGESDVLLIKDLEAYTVVGINPWERLVKQEINLNIKMYVDAAKAINTDDVADSVDYRELTKEVLKFVENARFKLIESLAHGIAKVCFRNLNLLEVEVELSKPGALRHSGSVGVKIRRKREDINLEG